MGEGGRWGRGRGWRRREKSEMQRTRKRRVLCGGKVFERYRIAAVEGMNEIGENKDAV